MIPWQIKAAMGAALFLSGTWSGWTAKTHLYERAEAKALLKAQEEHAAELAALQAELDQAAVDNINLSAELDAAKANTRTVTREIIKEVPKYAPTSTPECDYSLSAGLVSLHNSAAAGTAPRAVSAEDTTEQLLGAVPDAGYVSD